MDILTRYAGDEFVAIMPMASTNMAVAIGERIRSAVEEQKFAVRRGAVAQLGISVGAACFPEEGETTEELLTAAARKMQSNKHSRKSMLTLANNPMSTIDVLG
jgi:diguanylate cyclase (GGDEF)-like protein